MICLCATFPLIELPEIEEEMYEYVINSKGLTCCDLQLFVWEI